MSSMGCVSFRNSNVVRFSFTGKSITELFKDVYDVRDIHHYKSMTNVTTWLDYQDVYHIEVTFLR